MAPMTTASLMPPHHTGDACHCTTGPDRLSQKRLYLPIHPLPLWTQALTQHLLKHDELPKPGLTLRRSHLVLDLPQAGESVVPDGVCNHLGHVRTEPIHMVQRPRIAPQAFRRISKTKPFLAWPLPERNPRKRPWGIPASPAGGRCSRAAPAAPPACGCSLRKWRAARRGTA